MEQHSEQSRKPLTQQGVLKKAERHVLSLHREQLAVKFIRAFLAGYISLHERYDINIYTQRTTKLLTPISESVVTLKVLIQNKRIRWFTV